MSCIDIDEGRLLELGLEWVTTKLIDNPYGRTERMSPSDELVPPAAAAFATPSGVPDGVGGGRARH